MVVFTCESCFATLKKQQVDKHCSGKCRNAWAFTCIECHKTFEGFDYKDHTCSMTEVEKYQGQFLQKRRDEKEKAKQEKIEQPKSEKSESAKEEKENQEESPKAKEVGEKRSRKERDDEKVEKSEDAADLIDFPGWRKAAGQIIEKHGKKKSKLKNGAPYMKKKKMLKKIWKMYAKSKQFNALSLDQQESGQEKGYKGIEDVVWRIVQKETKRFQIDYDDMTDIFRVFKL